MAAYFEFEGNRYELADFNKLEIRELRELQRISGLNQGRIPLELAEGNVDAWVGMLVVSMRRVNPDVSKEDLDGASLNEILESFVDINAEEDVPPDPQTAPPSESGGNGGAPTPPTRTRGTVGTRPGISIRG